MILRLLSTYFFSLEYLLLYLIVLFLYESKNQLPPTLAFICIFMIGNLFLLYSIRKSQVSRVIPFLSAIISGGISYTLGLNSVASILCASFIYFRLEAFLKDTSLWIEERHRLQIIFYLTSLVVLFFGWTSHYSYMNLILWIIIIFTILFSLGRYFQQAVTTQTIKNYRGIIGSISIAALLTGIISLILPILKWGIFKLLDGLFRAVGILGTPLFNYVDHITIKEKKNKLSQNLSAEDKLPQNIRNHHYILESTPTWVWLILLMIVLIVIWLIIRKLSYIRNKKHTVQHEISIESYAIPEHKRKKRRFFKHSAPTEQIRKLIFQLQKYASKYKMGRHQNETLKEWLERIQMPYEDELINAYNSVRYGKGEIKDIEKYEEQVKRIKNRIKSKNKEEDKE
ncbi:hypothetical protein AN960_17460 [Bacillus sp. FJAT-25509]|uniref:hypothetical protein n=1 Tax=Bacillus sp. FJAT-25509 TaxID=1712029 RepID=UPI0006F27B81|nr:hypothetical protein [Bacillus sp. FJAT-25509]KQL36396.1 hypothetical protein AN960_17460 [Bacillus sp. FJAT-25509]